MIRVEITLYWHVLLKVVFLALVFIQLKNNCVRFWFRVFLIRLFVKLGMN